jgi:hypothetical protein
VKISVLLGFTIAAYNLDRVRSFRAKLAELAAEPKRRAKRRLGTWRDVVPTEAEPPEGEPKKPPG